MDGECNENQLFCCYSPPQRLSEAKFSSARAHFKCAQADGCLDHTAICAPLVFFLTKYEVHYNTLYSVWRMYFLNKYHKYPLTQHS